MIKNIDNETMILDRTLVSEKARKYDGMIITLSEREYQALPENVKNNGATYLTYNDEISD